MTNVTNQAFHLFVAFGRGNKTFFFVILLFILIPAGSGTEHGRHRVLDQNSSRWRETRVAGSVLRGRAGQLEVSGVEAGQVEGRGGVASRKTARRWNQRNAKFVVAENIGRPLSNFFDLNDLITGQLRYCIRLLSEKLLNESLGNR